MLDFSLEIWYTIYVERGSPQGKIHTWRYTMYTETFITEPQIDELCFEDEWMELLDDDIDLDDLMPDRMTDEEFWDYIEELAADAEFLMNLED
jgi:hypothetical protein